MYDANLQVSVTKQKVCKQITRKRTGKIEKKNSEKSKAFIKHVVGIRRKTRKLTEEEVTVAMMHVLALPPSDSCSSRVSLESLYGTCGWCSTRAVITLPSVSRLWLMLPASRARAFLAPERPTHSDLWIHHTYKRKNETKKERRWMRREKRNPSTRTRLRRVRTKYVTSVGL